MSAEDYYRAIWLEAVRGGGPLTGGPHRGSLAERLASAVRGFAEAGAEALRGGGWDCESLGALVRELGRLVRLLRADLIEEARLYGEPPGLREALGALSRLEEAALKALEGCRSTG